MLWELFRTHACCAHPLAAQEHAERAAVEHDPEAAVAAVFASLAGAPQLRSVRLTHDGMRKRGFLQCHLAGLRSGVLTDLQRCTGVTSLTLQVSFCILVCILVWFHF